MQLKPSDSYQQVQVRSFLGGFFVKHGQISLVSRKLTLFFRKWKNWHFIGNPRVRLAFFTTSILPRSAWGATLISPEVDTSMLLAHPILTVLATGENWRAMGCLSGRIAASEGDKQILASLLNDTLRFFFSKSHINRICLQKEFVSGSDLRVMAWRKRKKKSNYSSGFSASKIARAKKEAGFFSHGHGFAGCLNWIRMHFKMFEFLLKIKKKREMIMY